MHGCVFQALALVAIAAAGCSEAPPEAEPVPLTTAFDAATAETISGRVLWEGDIPDAPPLDMRTDPPVARGKTCPNPNLPAIDRKSRGVANAVVFLRGVDARKARPWDHAPVQVEMRDLMLHIRQDEIDTRVGFVRAGDAVEMVSREPILHGLEARGAAYFSLRFVDPDVPASRRFDNKGLVELSSAMPYSWMRAYLFVDEHPYYARTDGHGRFALAQAPPGNYQVVCWMPNWHIARRERDPENSLVNRLLYAPPVELNQKVTVPGNNCELLFTLSSFSFRAR